MGEDWADKTASKLIKDAGFALWEGPLAQALRDERSACMAELEERIVCLERRIAELDNRTVGQMMVGGPVS